MNKISKINTIGIIGFGNMGQAIMAKLAKKYPSSKLFVYDHSSKKGQFVFCPTAKSLIQNSDLIIIAVKPKSFDELASEIQNFITPEKTFVSVMAGIKIAHISKALNNKNIVRCMPNLAMKVDAGVTGWFANKTIKKSLITEFFDLWGFNFEVKSEEDLNVVTALSGCGPAYFYFLTDCLISSAKKLGLKPEQAIKLADQTFVGAARLFSEQNSAATDLIKAVASKGGATEAAIKNFKQNKFPAIFHKGISAALKRSKQMSK